MNAWRGLVLVPWLAGLLPAATIYVATNGTHDAANNFDSWAGAATNIHDAVALANTLGYDVRVGDGDFGTTNTLDVDGAYTLASENGPDATAIVLDSSGSATNIPVLRVAFGTAAGFTVRGGRTVPGWQTGELVTGLLVTNGVASNCVVRGNTGGTAVRIATGGLVTHSRIVSNTTYYVGRLGAGVLQDSEVAWHAITVPGISCFGPGVIRRCRIHHNTANGYASGTTLIYGSRLENSLIYANYTPGEYGAVNLTGGSVVNCTFFNNAGTSVNGGAGLYRTGGGVTNTILFGNTSTAGSSTPNYRGTVAGVVAFSCAPELTGGVQGNLQDDPRFADAAAGDLSLLPGSPCLDRGTNLAIVVDDLLEQVRPQPGGSRGGPLSDMGAYELNGTNGAFAVGFYGELPLSGFAPFEVAFRANAIGVDTNVIWYGWDFDGDGEADVSGPHLAVVTNVFGAGVHTVGLVVSNGTGESAASTNAAYVSVVGSDLFVATSGLHQFPYDTWGKAATNFHAAMDVAVAGCTVNVGTGLFAVTKETVILSPIRVVGQGRDETCLERNAAAGNFKILTVNHPDALVAGLMVRNGDNGTGYGTPHGINLSGGTVSNVTITLCSSRANSGRAIQIATARMVGCVVTNNGGNGVTLNTGGIAEDTLVADNGGSSGSSITPVVIAAANALMDRCRVIGNRAYANYSESGIYLASGTLRNTLIASNVAYQANANYAGGIRVAAGVMENCTITANRNHLGSSAGTGVHQTGGEIRNCVIFGNGGSTAGDYTRTGGTIVHSLAPELDPAAGGNLVHDPLFWEAAKGNFRLQAGSPCRDAGTNLAAVVLDLDGHARPLSGGTLAPAALDLGAYEADGAAGPFEIGFYGEAPRSGFPDLPVVLRANAAGADTNAVWYGWDFNNDGTDDRAGPGLGVVTNAFGIGIHTIVLRASNASLETATAVRSNYVTVVTPELYVAVDGLHQFPFDTWAKAATNVHAAVDAAAPGCTIRVGPGTFSTIRELFLLSDVRLEGSGPDVTILHRDAAAGEFRMASLNHSNAWLGNLTVRNGKAGTGAGLVHGLNVLAGTVSNAAVAGSYESNGYGVYLANGLMTASRVTNNLGSGVYLGVNAVLTDCLIADNGGVNGASYPPLILSQTTSLGDRCRVIGNRTYGQYSVARGVQLAAGTLRNSLVAMNRYTGNGANYAGGVLVSGAGALLESCTIAANTNHPSSNQGSGVHQTAGAIRNCVIWGNVGAGAAQYTTTGGTIVYSLAPTLTPGAPNFNLNADPLFADEAFRPSPVSPCLNAGTNLLWMNGGTDLDGGPRIRKTVVDLGCYEARPLPGTVIQLR